MTTTVTVTFKYAPQQSEETAMGDWLVPYLTAGNTTGFPLETIGDQIFREWDTVENAQAYIVAVNEIYAKCATSAVITA